MKIFRRAPIAWTLQLVLCFGAAAHSSAAGAPNSSTTAGTTPVVGGNPSGGDVENPMGGGNYDYFTADQDPGLSKYLALVSHRHVGEVVWARFWSGNYTEPLADCRYALERFPNHPRALHLVGEIAKITNQVSLAIPYFEYALRLYPQYGFTHAQYGHYLVDIGAFTAGVVELREALRLEPKQFQAKAWLAEALAAHPELGEEKPAPGSATGATAPKTSGGTAPKTSGAKGSR